MLSKSTPEASSWEASQAVSLFERLAKAAGGDREKGWDVNDIPFTPLTLRWSKPQNCSESSTKTHPSKRRVKAEYFRDTKWLTENSHLILVILKHSWSDCHAWCLVWLSHMLLWHMIWTLSTALFSLGCLEWRKASASRHSSQSLLFPIAILGSSINIQVHVAQSPALWFREPRGRAEVCFSAISRWFWGPVVVFYETQNSMIMNILLVSNNKICELI